MKIRSSFVTNSSSSSFVVAIKQQGFTKDDLLKLLMEEKDNLNLDCLDIDVNDTKRVKALLKSVAAELWSIADTPIGDVNVGSGTCSNEDGEEGFVLYNLGSVTNDNFVFKSGN